MKNFVILIVALSMISVSAFGQKNPPEKELPFSVVNTLNKDFQGYRKGQIEIFENTDTKGFELGLKKGETSIEVIVDNNGKVIKKTDKKEDEKTEKGKK